MRQARWNIIILSLDNSHHEAAMLTRKVLPLMEKMPAARRV
jgi:hypothetical protein